MTPLPRRAIRPAGVLTLSFSTLNAGYMVTPAGASNREPADAATPCRRKRQEAGRAIFDLGAEIQAIYYLKVVHNDLRKGS